MFDIQKFPIIILSSPRTFSTPIFDHINRKYEYVPGFSEPDNNPQELERFIDHASQSKNFILKIHAVKLSVFSKDFLANTILNPDNFFIRIRRRNLVDQVCSAYIAEMRRVWVYHPGNTEVTESFKNQPVVIDSNLVRSVYRKILKTNQGIDNVDVKFDLDLYHEDMLGLETIVVPTPLPTNYSLLQEFIKGIVNNDR